MTNFDLTGKVALVTGASYGIGFAIAKAYAEAGAKIVFNDIKQELVDNGLVAYKELGIEKCRFYDLRGTYATKVLNNGTKINDVANLLGHRNVETTENYYITSLEDNRKSAVELFDKNNKSNVIENVIKFQIQEGKLV